MNNHTISLYILIFFLFFIDISLFFFFEAQYAQLLLCFYLFSLFYSSDHYSLLSCVALLSCESFYYYGSFWPPFLYLAPITLGGIGLRKLFYFSPLQPFLLLFLGILVYDYCVYSYFFNSLPQLNYTIMKISGNIIVVICFSLTYKYWGEKGNRS